MYCGELGRLKSGSHESWRVAPLRRCVLRGSVGEEAILCQCAGVWFGCVCLRLLFLLF